MSDDKMFLSLNNFDFGFTLMDSEELEVVQEIRQEIETTSMTVEQLREAVEQSSAEAEDWKQRAIAISNAVLPLLNNLASNPEKEYIYWPNRVEKIALFKQKLAEIIG